MINTSTFKMTEATCLYISIINYALRALDAGTPQQIKDTDLYVTIGDVSRNDGVPEFIAPQV